jgi:hypothetical protein
MDPGKELVDPDPDPDPDAGEEGEDAPEEAGVDAVSRSRGATEGGELEEALDGEGKLESGHAQDQTRVVGGKKARRLPRRAATNSSSKRQGREPAGPGVRTNQTKVVRRKAKDKDEADASEKKAVRRALRATAEAGSTRDAVGQTDRQP